MGTGPAGRLTGFAAGEAFLIIVTGGAGFIGSCMVSKLNRLGRDDIVVVDSLGRSDKWQNLRHLAFADYLDKSQLHAFLANNTDIEAIVHMGACSATTETDAHYLMENNYRYTLELARHALESGVRMIYASSAATYGDGSLGYEDDEDTIHELRPLNMYGYSKQLFDLKARREGWFQHLAGLKFFNVYGPNEYHKGAMTSVVYNAFHQIAGTGSVNLFKSHHPDYEDGGQQRDFVYVQDAVDVMAFLLEHPEVNGLFNLGTGRARCFRDLALAVFAALEKEPRIVYVDMPVHLRDRYQYFTRADMSKLHACGYEGEATSLEAGVADYVRNYLTRGLARY